MKNKFPKQFGKSDRVKYTRFTYLGSYKIGGSVSDMNLKIGQSVITPDIINMRKHLLDVSTLVDYYTQYFNSVN